MKRILSISPWPSVWSQGEEGGSPSEAYAIRAMQEAGFAVTHLSPLAPGLPAREESEGMEIVRIANPFRRYRFIFKSGIAFLYRLPAIMEWTRLVSTWLRKAGRRYDLIIGHSSETVYALRLASRYNKAPAVSRLYGISATVDCLRKGLKRELYFDLISLFRHPPDHLVLTNDGTCGDLAAYLFGIQPDSFDFLLNGYEPSLLSMKAHETTPPYVITACRLVDWKRVDRVVEIAALCRDIRFLILGDGPERNSLVKTIEKLGLGDTVKIEGKVSRLMMHEYLKGASIVLATQDLSNLNNTVIEGMVLGKPVVALDTGCTKQLIHNNDTGLLFDRGDLEGVASGIRRLVKNKGLRRDLGGKARNFVLETLKPWPERIAQEAAIYRRFRQA